MQGLDVLGDAELLAEITRIAEENQLLNWFVESYPYRWQREFFDAGAFATHRCCMSANGVGKSFTVCAELAMHLTGRYPPYWQGIRFDYGGWEAWVGSIDNDMQKRGPQRALLGRDLSELGKGLIPKDAIPKEPRLRQAGVKDVVDTLTVNHVSGRSTTLKFLTFEQGWRKWQSGDPKIILWDEEPDESNVEQKDIYDETLTRLVRNNGIFMVAYTPLLGETQITKHFMYADDPSIWWIGATWDDAPHMSEEAKRKTRAQYRDHQVDARTKGIPMMGEGRIFKTPESSLLIDPVPIPDHWARICGIDIGLAHAAAAAWIAWDRDTNTFYLYDCWREKNKLLKDQAEVLKARGDWIPVAWPHDGEKRDAKSGQRFADTLRSHGAALLSKSARYKNDAGGPQPQWPVIDDLRDLMNAGRFKVFRTCRPWIEEYRSYHTKDGQIVARNDDTLKASFYAMMMKRYAISKREGDRMFIQRQSGPAPFTTAVH